MGRVVKVILNDAEKDPLYENLTIELNADEMVHIHLKNIRLDMTKNAYNNFYDGIKEAYEQIKNSKS